MDEFSTKLTETTVVSTILDKTSEKEASEPLGSRTNHREGILFQFEKLSELVEKEEGPKFILAHFLIPHFPYVLDKNCKTVTEKQAKSRSNEENYLNQLGCTNKKIKSIVTKIFEESAGSAIVILQSDEGPDPIHSPLNKKWQQSSIEAVKEKTGILNAYYLPEKEKQTEKLLYQSITPVNSFRVLFNLYFGTEFNLLDDRVYMIENKQRPYKFFDFTDRLK